MTASEMIGKKFSKLTVVGLCKIQRNKSIIQGLVCICDCGNECNVSFYGVKYGSTSSCGCNYRLNLIGKRFGMLVAIERVEHGVNKNFFKCKCDCGNERVVVSSELNRGDVISCGCTDRRRRVKYLNRVLYEVWKGIKARCYNKNHISYKNYGERGVIVCEEWVNDFKAFYDWCIENGWQEGLQIDKDAKGNGLLYSPGTCCILTAKENSRLTRRTKLNTVFAKEIIESNEGVTFLSQKYNVSKSAIHRVKSKSTWQ